MFHCLLAYTTVMFSAKRNTCLITVLSEQGNSGVFLISIDLHNNINRQGFRKVRREGVRGKRM